MGKELCLAARCFLEFFQGGLVAVQGGLMGLLRVRGAGWRGRWAAVVAVAEVKRGER